MTNSFVVLSARVYPAVLVMIAVTEYVPGVSALALGIVRLHAPPDIVKPFEVV